MGAAAIAIGAFAEGTGFASGSKPLVLAGFAVLLIRLAQTVRTLIVHPRADRARIVMGCPGPGYDNSCSWSATKTRRASYVPGVNR